MRYAVSCRLEYEVPGPSAFVFNLAPPETAYQSVESERLMVSPERPVEDFSDPASGNRYHRVEVAGGDLVLRYRATVSVSPSIAPLGEIATVPPGALPLHCLPYLLPSRHCESDRLMRLAWREFGALEETIERPVRVADWIYRNVDYLVGTTGSMTSAFDTATSRAGVCRDFAHLGIAFCRALNIPARFVSGYAYDLWPPDFHAMFEAWLGDRWYLFDPTRMASRGGLVRIGTGRDAADVSFALIFGPATLTGMDVSAEPCDAESSTLPPSWAESAVSTA